MQVAKKDIAWNFVATLMRVASGLIVLPLVLSKLSKDDVGIWNIMLQIGSLALLLDFGFLDAFARNVTYIFSGVKELKSKGYNVSENDDNTISYDLLKSVIHSMKWFYGIISFIFLVIYFIGSPFYLKNYIFIDYKGGTDAQVIWTSWFVYGLLIAYQLYTYYYYSILKGRGLLTQMYRIAFYSQLSRIIVTAILLISGYGIISLVIGQLVCDIVNRYLAYHAFYDHDLKIKLRKSVHQPVKEVMKILSPNAMKVGITTLGTFLTSKIVIIIAPILHIKLPAIGSYGTTLQIVSLIMSLSTLWWSTYYPKLTQQRIHNNRNDMKRLYIKGQLMMLLVYIICGVGLIFIIPEFFKIIHSKTQLVSISMMIAMLFFALLESNYAIANGFIVSGNEVPYMKSSLLTGIFSSTLLILMLKFTTLSSWAMILAPGIATSLYLYWKWPLYTVKYLKIEPSDYFVSIKSVLSDYKNLFKNS